MHCKRGARSDRARFLHIEQLIANATVILNIFNHVFTTFLPSANVTDKSTSSKGIRTTDSQFECTNWAKGKFPLATASRSTLYQHCYILPPQVKLRPGTLGHGQLNCYGSWLGYICILVLRTHPVPTSAPNVTDKSTSTEGIRTTDPQFEYPSTLPTELKGNSHQLLPVGALYTNTATQIVIFRWILWHKFLIISCWIFFSVC